MPKPVTVTYEVFPTSDAVALAFAQLFAKHVEQAVKTRGVARVAISGGTTPQASFKLLADPDQPFLATIPWDKLYLYWVDERCVGPDDPESNYGAAKKLLLDKVPLPAENIFRMEGELEPEEAANRYEAVLRNSMKLEGAESPAFDLLALGMGDDGHTASLFPHTAALEVMDRLCVANHVPQKDTYRVTLTWPVINQAREVVFAIEGPAKTDVLAEVFAGSRNLDQLPSQLIRPSNGKLLLLLDEVAAAKLPAAAEIAGTPRKLGTLDI